MADGKGKTKIIFCKECGREFNLYEREWENIIFCSEVCQRRHEGRVEVQFEAEREASRKKTDRIELSYCFCSLLPLVVILVILVVLFV